ncbi:MAG: hypothetical protein WC462_02275 [archaeon]
MPVPRIKYNPKFAETQGMPLMKTRPLSVTEIQEKKVDALIAKYSRPFNVINAVLKRNKKLSGAQQRVLSNRIKYFEGIVDEAFRKESELNPNSSKIQLNQKERMTRLFDFSQNAYKLVLKMENAGLVDKGFTHKAFRKMNGSVNNQKQ